MGTPQCFAQTVFDVFVTQTHTTSRASRGTIATLGWSATWPDIMIFAASADSLTRRKRWSGDDRRVVGSLRRVGDRDPSATVHVQATDALLTIRPDLDKSDAALC